jgi:hypothetical protein
MKKIIALLVAIALVAVAASATDAKASPAASPAAAKAETVAGTIVSFTADASKKTLGTLVIADAAKKQVSLVVLANAAIVDAKGKVLPVKDLVKGKKVTVEYTVAASKNEASKITF